MPHERNRNLEILLREDLKWSPAVGIYGLRQVGKTTLMRQVLARAGGEEETFDSELVLERARATPVEFLDRSKLLGIDEAQKAPWIFPVIKDLIGTRRKPGRFLLTGSIRFTLKQEVREALTGRITLHEVLPFSLAEAHQKAPSTFLAHVLRHDEPPAAPDSGPRWNANTIARYAEVGGMPIPCFTRDSDRRAGWYRSYFETLLTRDLVLVDAKLAKVSLRQGLAFLRALALHQGREASLSELIRATSVKRGLADSLVRAFEALSLIDLIPPEFHAEKSVRKLRIEWKDIGLWRHAMGIESRVLDSESGVRLLLTQEFRSQASLMARAPAWSAYRTRDGAEIPWIFRRDDRVVAITTFAGENPKFRDFKALAEFMEKEKSGIGLVLGASRAPITPLRKRIWLMPMDLVF